MTLLRPLRRSNQAALSELLGAVSFRLGPRTARVAANLSAHSSAIDPHAQVWIGADLPPWAFPHQSWASPRHTRAV